MRFTASNRRLTQSGLKIIKCDVSQIGKSRGRAVYLESWRCRQGPKTVPSLCSAGLRVRSTLGGWLQQFRALWPQIQWHPREQGEQAFLLLGLFLRRKGAFPEESLWLQNFHLNLQTHLPPSPACSMPWEGQLWDGTGGLLCLSLPGNVGQQESLAGEQTAGRECGQGI